MSNYLLVMIYLILGAIILAFVVKQNQEYIPYLTTLGIITCIISIILLWPLPFIASLINIIYEKTTQKIYKETEENNERSGN